MKKYIYSDLIEENLCSDFSDLSRSRDHIDVKDVKKEAFKIYKTQNTQSIPCVSNGNYITLFTSDIIKLSDNDFEELVTAVAKELACVIRSKAKKTESVLIVGLGNPDITADSLGAKTVEKLTIPSFYGKKIKIFAVSVGVSSVTGIETADYVKGLAVSCSPDVIVVIDSLVARSRKRLYSTVQISDSGIVPGAGVGKHRSPINEKIMGVPVISIGIPTVISSSTLICDALIGSGIVQVSEDMKAILESEQGFYVTSGYCDVEIKCASLMLSRAIELACVEHM